MSKKKSKKIKESEAELCKLYSDAIEGFTKYFRGKTKALKAKKIQKKAEPE